MYIIYYTLNNFLFGVYFFNYFIKIRSLQVQEVSKTDRIIKNTRLRYTGYPIQLEDRLRHSEGVGVKAVLRWQVVWFRSLVTRLLRSR